ncbi:MAG: hypothetical protein IJS39_02990 [Synergistaceae bacterium]|nr:hypothetical protein [Synergistaceae bacterium]
MANITSQSPIRYTIDALSLAGSGVLASKSSSSVNLTGASEITGIVVGGSQPSGTQRYFAFRVGGKWGKLTESGTFSAFSENSATFANISANGNTAAELSALTDIPALAGQNIGAAFALYASDPSNAVPTATLVFRCRNSTQQLANTQTSPVYDLGGDSQIISLNADTQTENSGSVSVYAQAVLDDGSSTGWKALDSFAGVKAKSIQFRGDYKAQTVGSSYAKINSVSLVYASGREKVSGLTDGEIITQTQDWYMPIRNCRLTINHAPLVSSTLKAYVAFREQPIAVKGETLGIGSGGRKTFQMAHTGGIKYDSLKLYYDNIRVYEDYELNTEVGRVTCEAPEGVIVSCDYTYGWDFEEWHQMSLTSRFSMDGYDRSEYRYSQPDNTKSMAAIKIVLGMTSGRITNEVLGTGTGKARSYKLTHNINDGKISITSNGQALSSKNWTLLDDPQYVSAAAPAGQTVRANYDWLSETPIVYQFAAVFAQ